MEIDRTEFSARDRERFARRLQQNLAALKQLLARPRFGAGPPTIGAEIELFIIDERARAKPVNMAIHAALADPRLTLELNRWSTPPVLADT